MNEEFLKSLSVTVTFLVLLPLIVAVFRRKKLIDVQRKLAYLIVVLAITEFLSYVLWYRNIGNYPVFHFYSILEFWLVLNIYRLSLRRWLTPTVVLTAGIVFTAFALLNMLYLQDLFEFNSNVTTTSGVLIIFLSLFSFFQGLIKSTHSSLNRNPEFWINSGFLLYFSSNLVLFYLSNRIDLSMEESYMIWGVHSIVNCILIIFYTIALWIRPKKD